MGTQSESLTRHVNAVSSQLRNVAARFGGNVPPLVVDVARAPMTWKRHEGKGAAACNPKAMRVEKKVLRDLAIVAMRRFESEHGQPWPVDAYYDVEIVAGVSLLTRGDVDNYAKLVLDSMNRFVYRDDCRVLSLQCIKAVTGRPQTRIVVRAARSIGCLDDVTASVQEAA